MKKKNLAASVRQRLLDHSRRTGEDFNRLLTRYIHERLLYRLSSSSYQKRFVLKGAVLFTVWQEGKPLHRSTKDLDLAGLQVCAAAELEEQFRSIVAHLVEDDGVQFDALVTSEPIMPREGIEMGVRLRLTARLGEARIPVQVDVGFGDDVYPAPEEVAFPTLLSFPHPQVQAYHRETVVAEKLQAWLDRGDLSSRVKDLFDLRFLAENFAFQAGTLQEAIQRTLARRGQSLGPLPPFVLSDELAQDPTKQAQWKAFLSRHQLPRQDLAETVGVIATFLMPLLLTIADRTASDRVWPPGGPWPPIGSYQPEDDGGE